MRLLRNGDGRAYVILPRTGGKRKYFGQYGTPESEAAYQKWYDNWSFWSRYRKTLTKTEAAVLSTALKYTDTSLPPSPRVLVEMVDALQEASFTKGNTTKRYSNTYIRKCLASVKRAIKWASARELIDPGTYAAVQCVEGPRGKAKTKPPVLVDTLKLLLPHLPKPVFWMVQIQFFAGMRPGEVCGMRWDGIEVTDTGVLYVPERHKMEHRGQSLVKALPDRVYGLLMEIPTEGTSPFIFASTGLLGHYRRDSYRNVLGRGCDRAGIPRITPNALRHGAATEIRRLAGIEAAQVYLGHSRVNTTELYARANVSLLQETARTMNQEFSKILG